MNEIELDELSEFLGKKPSGVYLLLDTNSTIDTIKQHVETAGFIFFHLAGHGLTSKKTFFDSAMKSLQFPDYFGFNWDAFYDCLNSMPIIPERNGGDVILYTDFNGFADADPDNFSILMGVFESVVKYRDTYRSDLPFYVLLRNS